MELYRESSWRAARRAQRGAWTAGLGVAVGAAGGEAAHRGPAQVAARRRLIRDGQNCRWYCDSVPRVSGLCLGRAKRHVTRPAPAPAARRASTTGYAGLAALLPQLRLCGCVPPAHRESLPSRGAGAPCLRRVSEDRGRGRGHISHAPRHISQKSHLIISISRDHRLTSSRSLSSLSAISHFSVMERVERECSDNISSRDLARVVGMRLRG